MPRQNRQRSSTGYYHVMSRGNHKQKIFIDDQDYNYFLKQLKKNADEFEISIICYCLMSNHYHLLIYDPEFRLSDFMHKINETYAVYFNCKNDLVGHLFQNRFTSENIEDQAYFLTAFRYILNNPIKAHISESVSQYRWSSYRQNMRMVAPYIISSDHILLSYFDSYRALDEYICSFSCNEKCLDIEECFESEEEAREYIINELGVTNPCEISCYAFNRRVEYIAKMNKAGLTCKQISKITQIPASSIYRVVRDLNDK